MEKEMTKPHKIQRVGVYGGTFSPPHYGHLHAAKTFLSEGMLDRLLIVPTFVTPLKDRQEQTSAEDRLAMCRLAFSFSPQITVSDVEIRRQGKSYTADTLAALSSENTRLCFLCGTDMFLSMDTWHAPRSIFALAEIVCMQREDDADVTARLLEKAEEYRARFAADVRFLTTRPLPMSSTEVRTRLQAGEDCSSYLPACVLAYIGEKELYR